MLHLPAPRLGQITQQLISPSISPPNVSSYPAHSVNYNEEKNPSLYSHSVQSLDLTHSEEKHVDDDLDLTHSDEKNPNMFTQSISQSISESLQQFISQSANQSIKRCRSASPIRSHPPLLITSSSDPDQSINQSVNRLIDHSKQLQQFSATAPLMSTPVKAHISSIHHRITSPVRHHTRNSSINQSVSPPLKSPHAHSVPVTPLAAIRENELEDEDVKMSPLVSMARRPSFKWPSLRSQVMRNRSADEDVEEDMEERAHKRVRRD